MKPDVPQLIMSTGGIHSVRTIAEAYAWCQKLASSHYENFPIASRLLPARARLHITAVYAFARFADDVADEPWTQHKEEKLSALSFIEDALLTPDKHLSHPIFLALHNTIAECGLPLSPFQRLLQAFRQDVDFRPPEDWGDVLNYCSCSADPVGELVLRISGNYSSESRERSNSICTALQIINFVQDTSVDVAMGRITYPGTPTEAIERVQALLLHGVGIVEHVGSWRLRLELKFIIAGGNRIAELCKKHVTNIRVYRPSIQRSDYLRILLRVLFGTWKTIS